MNGTSGDLAFVSFSGFSSCTWTWSKATFAPFAVNSSIGCTLPYTEGLATVGAQVAVVANLLLGPAYITVTIQHTNFATLKWRSDDCGVTWYDTNAFCDASAHGGTPVLSWV